MKKMVDSVEKAPNAELDWDRIEEKWRKRWTDDKLFETAIFF